MEETKAEKMIREYKENKHYKPIEYVTVRTPFLTTVNIVSFISGAVIALTTFGLGLVAGKVLNK